MSNNTQSTRVITGIVRCSYVNVFEPRKNVASGKDEFSMTLLVPKSDQDTIRKLAAALEAAKAAKWGGKPPTHLLSPVHDGDGPKPNGGDYGDECKGHWVINVKSNTRPGVVDVNLAPVMDRADFQSGDYARVSLNAYGYDNKRIGVAFGLNNIQVLRKGDPLSGRTRAEDDFTAMPGFGAPAPAAPQGFGAPPPAGFSGAPAPAGFSGAPAPAGFSGAPGADVPW